MNRYIDAEALKQDLIHNRSFYPAIVKSAIENAPTADVVEVRHGRWLPTNTPSYFGGVIYECSLCKAKDGDHSSILGQYCWRCGAKMDGEKENRQ